MDIQVIKCPCCGGILNMERPEGITRCEHCGNTLHIKKRNVNGDGSIPITDPATKRLIGTVRLPFGYEVRGMLNGNLSSYTYPFGVNISAKNTNTLLIYSVGEGFCDRSKCPALSGMYSQGLEQISRTHYRDFLDVRQYADSYVTIHAKAMQASSLSFVEERPLPLYEPFNEEEALANYKQRIAFEKQRIGNASMAKDLNYYLKGLCRIYNMTIQNTVWKVAVSTVLEAWQYQLVGMSAGLFGLLQTNIATDWQSDGIFILQAPPEDFEFAFQGAYTDFCSTYRPDNGIREMMYNMQSQILDNIAAHTQQQINRMNQQFQSWQQIHATQQAAFDSYNRSWWNRTNAADAARRNASRNAMSSMSSSDCYSEAIRGVNTYLRPDGTEVEVSVAYDNAYTNYSNDTLGTNSAFHPGDDWTQMERL